MMGQWAQGPFFQYQFVLFKPAPPVPAHPAHIAAFEARMLDVDPANPSGETVMNFSHDDTSLSRPPPRCVIHRVEMRPKQGKPGIAGQILPYLQGSRVMVRVDQSPIFA